MFRGTIRYAGWCETLRKIANLGLLDEKPLDGTPVSAFAKLRPGSLHRAAEAAGWADGSPGPSLNTPVLDRRGRGCCAPSVARRPGLAPRRPLGNDAGEDGPYQPGERDMIVLRHEFLAEYS